MLSTHDQDQFVAVPARPDRPTAPNGILPAAVVRALAPQGPTTEQGDAINEVARRVHARHTFDIDNPQDVTTIAQFLSAGGNAIVPFDYMFCWVSHPGEPAVNGMLDTIKGRNPTAKPASIAIRPRDAASLIDAGGPRRDMLTGFFMHALLDQLGAGVRFLASSAVPRHLALAHEGRIVAQVIAPQADSDFYRLLDAFQRITGLGMLAITSANWANERGPHYRLQGALETLGTVVPVLAPSDVDLRTRQLKLVQERMQLANRHGIRMIGVAPDELDKRVPMTLWPFKLCSTTIVTACDYHEVAGVVTLTVHVVRHGSVHIDEIRNVVRTIDRSVHERFDGRAQVVISADPAPSRLWARRYGTRSSSWP